MQAQIALEAIYLEIVILDNSEHKTYETCFFLQLSWITPVDSTAYCAEV